MRSWLLFIFLIFLSSFFVGLYGCQDTSTTFDSKADILEIVVKPAGDITVGFFERQTFEVKLEDAAGNPMVSGPVTVSFEGMAHNALLDPTAFNTDENGAGEVIFTAPDKKVQFNIRFSSPAVEGETLIKVSVEPERVGLSLNVTYSGRRPLSVVEVELFDELSCEDLAAGSVHESVKKMQEDTLPALLSFSGLHFSETYAASVKGKDIQGEVCAVACIDNLIPDLKTSEVVLSDISLDISGYYEIITEINTNGVLDKEVDGFQTYFNQFFVNDPARSILNGISRVIKDPVILESYEKLREEYELELILNTYFQKNSIQLDKLFEPIWHSIKGYLSAFTAYGTFELVSPDKGNYPLFHQIDRLDFSDEERDPISIYLVDTPERGEGIAQVDGTDYELLHIGEHEIGLGLANPVVHLFIEEVDRVFEVQEINRALESSVDCERLADELVPWLSGVADRTIIHYGCVDATLQAEQKALEQTVLLNTFYSQLTFKGNCLLEEPASGNQVRLLDDGVFEVTWTGLTQTPLGPMDASFRAALSDKQ